MHPETQMVLGESRFYNKEYKKLFTTFRINIRIEEHLLIRTQEAKMTQQKTRYLSI
jgi:hypothetical protein